MNEQEQNNVISLTTYIRSESSPVQDHSYRPRSASTPPMSKKVFAFWVDFSLILTLKLLCTVGYGAFLESYFYMMHDSQVGTLLIGDFGLHLSVTMLLYFSYFVFCNYTLEGKTLGKAIFGLRTINDGFVFDKQLMDSSMDLSQSIRRSFGYLLCYLSFGTFFSFSFFSEDKRGLQDFFSGSRTVTDEWIDSMLQFKAYETEVVQIDIVELSRASIEKQAA